MLDYTSLDILSEWDSYKEQNFIQDTAPSHFVLPFGAWLDSHCSGQWIGRWGQKDWHGITPYN